MINTNLGPISHCFRDLGSFLMKSAHFSYSLHWTPSFEKVPIALHPQNFIHEKPRQRPNYLCKKFSPKTYPLARVHPLHTDGQTEGEMDNNHAIDAIRHSHSMSKTITVYGYLPLM